MNVRCKFYENLNAVSISHPVGKKKKKNPCSFHSLASLTTTMKKRGILFHRMIVAIDSRQSCEINSVIPWICLNSNSISFSFI